MTTDPNVRLEYREATDIEVVTIELVRNIRVDSSSLDRAMESLQDAGSAAIVRRKGIGDTYQEACAILVTRSEDSR